MKNFTVTEAKVKTLYTIQIGPEDIINIIQAINGTPRLKDLLPAYGSAADDLVRVLATTPASFSSDDLDDGVSLLQMIWNTPDQMVDVERFIVQEVLGFEGIENFGYFDKYINRAVMVVYRYGDRIN